jgi:hypothetical protein
LHWASVKAESARVELFSIISLLALGAAMWHRPGGLGVSYYDKPDVAVDGGKSDNSRCR